MLSYGTTPGALNVPIPGCLAHCPGLPNDRRVK